jgi:hypothetical protein
MLRRSLLVAVVALLAACGNCDSPCKSGITFYVTSLAGSLAPGTKEDVKFCLDDSCSTSTISRDMVGGTVFVESGNVGAGDHTVTVSAEGGLSATYTGAIEAFEQQGGADCDTCKVGAVKVSADGTLTPGVAVPNSTTTAPATTGG